MLLCFEEPSPHLKKGKKNQHYCMVWKRHCFFLCCRTGCQCNFIKWDDILIYQSRCLLACLWQLFSSLFLATKEHLIRLNEVGSAQQELISLCNTGFLKSLCLLSPPKSTKTPTSLGVRMRLFYVSHLKIKPLGMTRRRLVQNGNMFLSLFRFLCIFSSSHTAFFPPDIFLSFLPSTFQCNSEV